MLLHLLRLLLIGLLVLDELEVVIGAIIGLSWFEDSLGHLLVRLELASVQVLFVHWIVYHYNNRSES